MENPITDEQRSNLLCSAIEGGSNYWYLLNEDSCQIINEKGKPQGSTERIPLVDKMFKALQAAAEIPVYDIEDATELLGKISMSSIKRGEEIMVKDYPGHFADIISESDDANTGDVWFQLAVMGQVVYG